MSKAGQLTSKVEVGPLAGWTSLTECFVFEVLALLALGTDPAAFLGPLACLHVTLKGHGQEREVTQSVYGLENPYFLVLELY